MLRARAKGAREAEEDALSAEESGSEEGSSCDEAASSCDEQGTLHRAHGKPECEDVAAAAAPRGRSGGVSVRVIVLLAMALAMAYAGFEGGNALAALWDEREVEADEYEEVNPDLSSDELEEEDSDGAAESARLEAELEYPQLVHAYYKKHNPKHLADVPNILARYAGHEDELFKKLEAKYGAPVLGSDGPSGDTSKSTSQAKEPSLRGHTKERATPPPRRERRQKVEQEQEEEPEEEPEEDEPPQQRRGRRQRQRDADEEMMQGAEAEAEAEEEEEDFVQEEEDGSGGEEGDAEDWDENGDGDDPPLPDQGFDLSQERITFSASGGAGGELQQGGGRGNVKVLVFGMPGTGVDLVHGFLASKLGLNMQNADETCATLRLALRQRGTPEFNKFDAFDGLADDSMGLAFEQLMATYPLAKVVIVVRDVDDWFQDFAPLAQASQADPRFLLRLEFYQHLLGAAPQGNELLWKTKYWLFYERLLARVPRSKRKLMHVHEPAPVRSTESSNWSWLATFLGRPEKAPPASWQPLGLASTGLRPVPSSVTDALAKLHRIRPASGAEGVSPGHLKVLVVGMEGAGLDAIAAALKKLGFAVASHFLGHQRLGTAGCSSAECRRVVENVQQALLGSARRPSFGYGGVFQGVDAVVGAPADLFVSEALQANPDLKVVLAVRNLDQWWRETKCLMQLRARARAPKGRSSRASRDASAAELWDVVYGPADASAASEHLVKARYYEHLDLAQTAVPRDRLLVLDAARAGVAGDAWRQLCDFLRSRKCTPRLLASKFPSVGRCSRR